MPSDYVKWLVARIQSMTREDIDRVFRIPRVKVSLLGLSPLEEARLILQITEENESTPAIKGLCDKLRQRISQYERGGLVLMKCDACGQYYFCSATREGDCLCTRKLLPS